MCRPALGLDVRKGSQSPPRVGGWRGGQGQSQAGGPSMPPGVSPTAPWLVARAREPMRMWLPDPDGTVGKGGFNPPERGAGQAGPLGGHWVARWPRAQARPQERVSEPRALSRAGAGGRRMPAWLLGAGLSG